MKLATLIGILMVTFVLASCSNEPAPPTSPNALGQATADWYATSADFIVSPQNVEIPTGSTKDVEVTLRNHDFVFSMGYYWDGSKWSSFDLSGQKIGNSLWLQDIGTFTKTLDLQNFPPDTYYFLTYGCKLLPNNAFDCNNDKWLIQEVQVTEKEVVSLPQNPSDPNSGACTTDYAPVCGEDGKTYSNSCVLEQAGVVLAYPGECQKIDDGGLAVSDFKEKPSTYTIGSGKSLEFVPGDDAPANYDVQFQAWSVTQGAIVAAKKDSTAPYIYDASLLDTIPAGKANIQARVRALNADGSIIAGQTTQYGFDIEIVNGGQQQTGNDDVFKDEWEAEAGDLSSDWVVSDGAIDHTAGELLSYADSNPQATYKFSVDKAGVYAVYGLTLAPSNTQDSFFVNVNTKPTQDNIWDVQQTSTFSKNQVRWRNAGLQTFQLDAGTHTLYVTGREQGTKIDKWYVELVEDTTTTTIEPEEAVCGNGIVEVGEECDGSASCTNQCTYQSTGDECSDGIDNDGDGLTDFGEDLGCYGPNDGTEAALSLDKENGWHTWDPRSDTKIIYVSTSGSDSNPGTIEKPVRKIQTAVDMLRPGKPDWVLLKSGDVWDKEYIVTDTQGGPSEQYPVIIGAYGTGPRPKIMPPANQHGIKFAKHEINYIVVNGLYINGEYRRPDSNLFDKNIGKPGDKKGIHLSQPTRDSSYTKKIVIQDNKIDFFDSGTHVVDQWPSRRQVYGLGGNIWLDLRRNIIEYSISDDSHAIGSYIEGVKEGSVVVENFYHHNGWYQTPAQKAGNKWDHKDGAYDIRKKEEHNIYGQKWNPRLFVYGNVFAEGATTGIQMRAGGDLICNALLGNAIAAWVTRGSDKVTHNFVYDAANIVPGLWGNDKYGGTKSLKYYKDTRGFGLQVDTDSDIEHNWVVKNPRVHGAGAFAIKATGGSKLSNNVIADWVTKEDGPILKNDVYGDYGQSVRDSFDKSPGTYASTLGLGNTKADFYKAAGNRARGDWPTELSAAGLYKYISGRNCPIDGRAK